jgi:hypothetical protein
VGKSLETFSLGIKRWWEDNIKIYLREIVGEV